MSKENKRRNEYNCLMVSFTDSRSDNTYPIIKKIKEIQSKIDKNDLYVDKEEGIHGLEKEYHVTVLYGIHPKSEYDLNYILSLFPKKDRDVRNVYANFIKLGIFENEKFDVLKIDVESKTLSRLNKILRDKVEYTSKFPDYRSHLTIAYLKKGKGEYYLDYFKHSFKENIGTEISPDSWVYSTTTGKKERAADLSLADEVIEEMITRIGLREKASEVHKTTDSDFYKIMGALGDRGYMCHGTNSQFDHFDPEKIAGGFRGKEGYGVYFTMGAENAYKVAEYGEYYHIVSTEGMVIARQGDTFESLGVVSLSEYNRNLYRLEQALYDARNNREYNEINNEIEETKTRINKFFNNIPVEDSRRLKENFDTILAPENNIRDLLSFAYNNLTADGMESASHLLLNLGIDCYVIGNVYVVINFDKLRQNTVQDPDALINSVMNISESYLVHNLQESEKLIEKYGYSLFCEDMLYTPYSEEELKRIIHIVDLQESVHDKEVTVELIKNKTTLYHLIPLENIEDVMKNGIQPHKSDSERIYFNKDKNSCLDISKMLGDKKQESGKYVLLYIKPHEDNLPNRFYKNSDTSDVVYCCGDIIPAYLNIDGVYDEKKKKQNDIKNENVVKNQILKEYLSSTHGMPLLKYLNMSDEEKKQDLVMMYDNTFRDFINNIRSEYYMEDEYGLSVSDVDSLIAGEVDDIYGYLVKRSPKLLNAFYNHMMESIEHGETVGPSWFYLDNGTLVKNQWLIHFSDNADQIAKYGFKYGVYDFTNLGLTKYLPSVCKNDDGYGFAYDVNDFKQYYRSNDYRGNPKYGSEAVVFRASGVKAWHHGDEEEQVIFELKSARDFVYIRSEEGRWKVVSTQTERELIFFDDIERCVNWVINNYPQYYKHLHEVTDEYDDIIEQAVNKVFGVVNEEAGFNSQAKQTSNTISQFITQEIDQRASSNHGGNGVKEVIAGTDPDSFTEFNLSFHPIDVLGELNIHVELYSNPEEAYNKSMIPHPEQLYVDNGMLLSDSGQIEVIISLSYADRKYFQLTVDHEVRHLYDIYFALYKKPPGTHYDHTLRRKVNDYDGMDDRLVELYYVSSKDEVNAFTQQSHQEMKDNGGNFRETTLYNIYFNLQKLKKELLNSDDESITSMLDAIPVSNDRRPLSKKDLLNDVYETIKNYAQAIRKVRRLYGRNNVSESINFDEVIDEALERIGFITENDVEEVDFRGDKEYSDYTGQNTDYIERFIQQKYNTTIYSHLGSGGYGQAYLLNNGNVFKITSDLSELQTVKQMIGKTFKHLANVYDYGKFDTDSLQISVKGDETENVESKYYYISEYVDSSNSDIIYKEIRYVMNKIIVNESFDYLSYWYIMDTLYDDPDKFLQDLNGMGDIIPQDEIKLLTQLTEGFIEARQIKDAVIDFNKGNLGYDDAGNLKIFDIQNEDEIDEKRDWKEEVLDEMLKRIGLKI